MASISRAHAAARDGSPHQKIARGFESMIAGSVSWMDDEADADVAIRTELAELRAWGAAGVREGFALGVNSA